MTPSAELIQEAAAALADFGMHIEPVGNDLVLWKVGGMTFTSDELLELARQFGLLKGEIRP